MLGYKNIEGGILFYSFRQNILPVTFLYNNINNTTKDCTQFLIESEDECLEYPEKNTNRSQVTD